MRKMTVSYVKQDIDRNLRMDIMFAHENSKMLTAVAAVMEADGYEKVASIEIDENLDVSDNLEHAYKIMQNGVVTDSWTLSPPDGLEPLVKPHVLNGENYGHRSMSMGDLIEIDGVKHVVASFGFLLVEKRLLN